MLNINALTGATMNKIETSATVYLNQRLVFDMLASIEDGFSQIATIEKEIKRSNKFEGGAEAGVEPNKILSFLPIKLSGKLSGEKASHDTQHHSETRVHTPASLFVKLAINLIEQEKIKNVIGLSDLGKIESGDIICFKGIFRKNPITSILESFQQFCELLGIASSLQEDKSNPQHSGKKGKLKAIQNKTNDPNFQLISEKVDEIILNMKSKGLIDIVSTISPENDAIRVVLQVYEDCFANGNMNEIVDGEFGVIGKVVSVSSEEKEKPINLLRNTSLSFLNSNSIQLAMETMLATEEFQAVLPFITIPDIELEITGNSLLVIPIAIYA